MKLLNWAICVLGIWILLLGILGALEPLWVSVVCGAVIAILAGISAASSPKT